MQILDAQIAFVMTEDDYTEVTIALMGTVPGAVTNWTLDLSQFPQAVQREVAHARRFQIEIDAYGSFSVSFNGGPFEPAPDFEVPKAVLPSLPLSPSM